MNLILRRVFARMRTSLFPTEHDLEIKKWFEVDGDEVRRFDYDLNSDSLVMDLGGYKGQWASDIYSMFNCRVIVFEPVNSFAKKISKRFLRNPKIEVFCMALGASKRQETIALSADGTSVYADSHEKETIQFEDVANFLLEHGIQHVDLLKINIEGGEYELLPRLLESGFINNIKHIQIQFHDIASDSESRMEKICNELSKSHRPTYQYKFVWENWTRRDVMI
jgi:FkbM family methyltransferase